MSAKDDVKQLFEGLASRWDGKAEHIQHITGESERLFRLMPSVIHPDCTVIDIGCGTGIVYAEASRLLTSFAYYGVDNSSRMLHELVEKFPQATTIEADCEEIPLADGVADVITVRQVLHHLSNPTRAMREWARLLKGKGSILVLALGERYQSNLYPFSGDESKDHLGRHTLSWYEALFRAANLQIDQIYDDHFTVDFDNFAGYAEFMDCVGETSRMLNYRIAQRAERLQTLRTDDDSSLKTTQPYRMIGHYYTFLATSPTRSSAGAQSR